MASKSRRFIGTRVAVPPTFWISSSVSSSAPTVRATQITCAPAAPSAMAAARPMPRDAPVTSAILLARGLVMENGSVLGDAGQQRQLPRAARQVSQRDGIIARETGVAEGRRLGITARHIHRMIKPVHRDESQA